MTNDKFEDRDKNGIDDEVDEIREDLEELQEELQEKIEKLSLAERSRTIGTITGLLQENMTQIVSFGGVKRTRRPVEGRKLRKGSSALMRHSMAQPSRLTSPWVSGSFSPAATRIISSTRSSPVMHSVTGCSTWRRVFISRK